MKRRKRFAVMVFAYDCSRTLLRMLNNCAPFVDRIYVVHNDLPWSVYNPRARDLYRNPTQISLINQSAWISKIDILREEWCSEEAARNHCLALARRDGMDYLILQDADEFYRPEDYQCNLDGIEANPRHKTFRTPWVVFWKNLNYVLESRFHEGRGLTAYTHCPLFAVNVGHDLRFTSLRMVNDLTDMFDLGGLCLHLSWVYSDDEVRRKISTWGHSAQVRGEAWFHRKWLAWEPSTKNLSPFDFVSFSRAVPFRGQLPAELSDFPVLAQESVRLTKPERFRASLLEHRYRLSWELKRLKSRVWPEVLSDLGLYPRRRMA